MSFGGFGSTGFGQNNQQQSTGFGGFGANTTTTTGTCPRFHSSPSPPFSPVRPSLSPEIDLDDLPKEPR